MNKEKVLQILQKELPHGARAQIARYFKVSKPYITHVLKGFSVNPRVIDYAVEFLKNYKEEEEAIYAIKLNKLTGRQNE